MDENKVPFQAPTYTRLAMISPICSLRLAFLS